MMLTESLLLFLQREDLLLFSLGFDTFKDAMLDCETLNY